MNVDFDEVQKAMEDTVRDAFDYFLDVETGDVTILSDEIITLANTVLSEHFDDDMDDFDEIELDEECDLPGWMEDEIELALNIFLYQKDRFVRIPERSARGGYTAMKEFVETLEDGELRKDLSVVLDGKGIFRKFKDLLEPYPKERKLWYGFNAKAMKGEIAVWLRSIGVEAEER